MFNLFKNALTEQDEREQDQTISHLLGDDDDQSDISRRYDHDERDDEKDSDDTEKHHGIKITRLDKDDETNSEEGAEQEQNPDRQGLIRTVPNAHLVYKRQASDGTFEELWIYNVSKMQDEIKIRRAILSGTDIPVDKKTSPDGNQRYEIWSISNAEMLHIIGLVN